MRRLAILFAALLVAGCGSSDSGDSGGGSGGTQTETQDNGGYGY